MTKVCKKVMAIIVTYNRKELLKESIECLLNQDYENCDILVVDNASTDGTREYITEELKNSKVHYINTGKNLGGAGGFNFGMKEAYKIGCDYMWLMDDDCMVHKESLTELIRVDEKLNGNYGFLSSKVLWKDDSICKMNIQKNNLIKKNSDWDTSLVKVIMATFVSFFVRKELVEEVGLPITDFFIWSDDLEYSRRLSRKYNCYLVNNSVVTHKSKNNIGSNIVVDDNSKLDRYRCAYRNEYYLFKREGLIGKLYYFLKIKLHKHKIRQSDNSTEDKKVKIDLITEAVKNGKKFNPKIEYAFKQPIRVLQMFGEPLSNGGQESAIMNLYRNIDREKIQFDFFTPFYNDNLKLKEEIISLGGKVFALNGKFESLLRKHYFVSRTKEFFKSQKYEIVHINSGSIFELAVGAKIAKKYGAKKVIVHSHATGIDNLKHTLSKARYSKYFTKYPDILVACSRVAGEWKFPDSCIQDSNNFHILPNGVNLEKFKFDEHIRKEYRKKLEIDDKKVILNVGRLTLQKNQLFLIEVMKVITKKDDSFVLFIVGLGELEGQLKKKIEEYTLGKNVILLGKRTDIPELLSASDVFAFPSLWEGAPVATVEAQATGLPVISSTNITTEAKVLESFTWCDLEKGPEYWAKEIIKLYNEYCDKRDLTNKVLKESGLDAKDTAKKLEDLYL